MIHPATMFERLPLFSPVLKLIKVFIDNSGSFRYAARYILIPFVQRGNQMHDFFLLHTETID